MSSLQTSRLGESHSKVPAWMVGCPVLLVGKDVEPRLTQASARLPR